MKFVWQFFLWTITNKVRASFDISHGHTRTNTFFLFAPCLVESLCFSVFFCTQRIVRDKQREPPRQGGSHFSIITIVKKFPKFPFPKFPKIVFRGDGRRLKTKVACGYVAGVAGVVAWWLWSSAAVLVSLSSGSSYMILAWLVRMVCWATRRPVRRSVLSRTTVPQR